MKYLAFVLLMTHSSLLAQTKIGSTAAQFLGIGVGARPLAMGGANVAIADGANALYWNPGGITQSDKNALEFSNAQWFVGSQIQNAAATFNMGATGTVGLSMTALNYGEMEVTTVNTPEGTGELFSPSDLSFGLSYAKKLTDKFSIGGTAKYIRQKIWNEKATGAAIDMGVIYNTQWKNMRIGMAITNFGSDMKMEGRDLRVTYDPNTNINGNNGRLPANLETNPWSLPLTYRVGVAMDAMNTSSNRLTLALDGVHPSDNATNLNAGLEYAVKISNTAFAMRGGYRQAFAASASDGGWTVGGGFQYGMANGMGINLDASLQSHQYLGNRLMWTFGAKF